MISSYVRTFYSNSLLIISSPLKYINTKGFLLAILIISATVPFINSGPRFLPFNDLSNLTINSSPPGETPLYFGIIFIALFIKFAKPLEAAVKDYDIGAPKNRSLMKGYEF